MERLYQPDFQCIFGPKYANAFNYDQVDSLVWPILNDIKPSQSLETLLQFKNFEGHPYFYHRKIDLLELKIEFNCSGIDHAFIQAMDLNRTYGISNSDGACGWDFTAALIVLFKSLIESLLIASS